ncbi:hypothetical protein NECAME_04751 [Necator americanus]|uniref:Uncharacterized protein n=1 Tax=Necator americanus TaxID=51031 RepID=W2SMN4_NECAM|nr:hypothetical protein NECAME_04751 [Necator americanus]ETN70900.1 hypothetical protein NECAME_04751 [Necator americanus]
MQTFAMVFEFKKGRCSVSVVENSVRNNSELLFSSRFEYTRKQKPSMNLFRHVQKRLLLLQAMYLYVNLPWIINERDYNCSGRTVSEWLARGQIDYVQGIYFAVSGTIFLVFYLLTLIVMYRESMLDHSCYRLMFFGGVIDVICLIIGSHLTAYFHIRGTVFCSDSLLDQFAGHSTWSLWNGSSLNCVILAINRAIEMLPLLQGFRFLFRGKVFGKSEGDNLQLSIEDISSMAGCYYAYFTC